MKFSNKLSFAILATGLIVLIISSFTLYNFSYNTVIDSQFMYTQSIADEISDDINIFLFEKVKTALTLANTPIIKKALETSNLSYTHLSDEKRKTSIKRLNEKWKSTKDPADNFILKFTDNKVSHFLKNQQRILKGEYGEIFLTNKFGALVASTAKLSTLAHGHKYWWLGSYNNGEGAIFFDDRGYDDSVGGYVLGLVVPIRKGMEIIGVLKCNLNILGSISELMFDEKNQLLGKLKLVRSGGMVVFEKGFEPLSTQVHGSIFEKLKNKKSGSFIINDSGEKYIVGCSEIEVTKGGEGYGFGGTFESIDHKKGNTGESWYVVCSRQMSAALMPFTQSIKTIILIGIAIILILVLVSYLFGRKIAKPLAVLNNATEKIGTGDFEYRIGVMGKDEFGNLGNSFNSMASKLQQTTTSIVELEHEITERKQAEKALRGSEQRYRHLFDYANEGLLLMTLDGGLSQVNQAFADVHGYTIDELKHMDIRDLDVFKERALEERTEITDRLHAGEIVRMEVEHYHKDGRILSLNVTTSLVELGGSSYYLAFHQDVTDRIQAEKKLKESHDLLENLASLVPGVIYQYRLYPDGSSAFPYSSPGMNDIYEVTPEQVGEDASVVFGRLHPEDHDKVAEAIFESARTLNTFYSEFRVKLPRQGLRWRWSQANPQRMEDGGTLWHGIIIDISDRKLAEEGQTKLKEQLQQSQKMEAIGTLAGGIAHDFNNILAIILGNAELASDDVPDWNPASNSLKEICLTSLRAKDMVHQLLAFSRKSDEESKPIDIAPITKESMKMLRSSIPTSVEFKQHISDDACNVMGDAAQINQIVMNLAINAADAMSEEGGLLEMTLENIILQEEKACFDWVLSPGPYVRLRMRDTGEGIEPKIIDRIFEPYYTTKEVGKGTGMGLSVIHGIVKKHGGGILVESEIGKGTVFEIYFPALEKTAEEEKPPDGEIKGGSERILFVDDEESMVNLNRQRLERLGYQVKSTTKPVEALEWFRADPDQFDVIITDMTMPRMTGDRLAIEVLKIRPRIPVIICTGYSERMSAKKAAALGVRKYIEKPIDLRNMASSIREVLDVI